MLVILKLIIAVIGFMSVRVNLLDFIGLNSEINSTMVYVCMYILYSLKFLSFEGISSSF